MIQSPCIKICQLDDEAICIGCYRSASEIGAWWQADAETQQTILDIARQRQRDYASRRRHKGLMSDQPTTHK